jgi:hypothetical protein
MTASFQIHTNSSIIVPLYGIYSESVVNQKKYWQPDRAIGNNDQVRSRTTLNPQKFPTTSSCKTSRWNALSVLYTYYEFTRIFATVRLEQWRYMHSCGEFVVKCVTSMRGLHPAARFTSVCVITYDTQTYSNYISYTYKYVHVNNMPPRFTVNKANTEKTAV